MANTRAKKRKLKAFSKFLIIYTTALAVVIAVVWIMLYSLMKDYEEGRPNVTMDKIIGQFTAENVENMLNESNVTFNEFENNQRVAEYLKERLGNDTVSYKKKAGEYSEDTPVYVVYANETAIAKVTLAANGKNAHKFTKWKLGTISFDGYTDKNKKDTFTFTVPKNSVLQINGVTVSENYITEDDVAFDPCRHVSEYVTAPAQTVYTVTGLIAQPEVAVTYNGAALEVTEQDGSYSAGYPTDEQMLAEHQDNIMSIAKDYGRYIINRGSLAKLNTNMIGYARDYVSDIPAIWAFLYGMTYTYEFQNESITNFTKYSDDCFSCDIYYDLYVAWGNGDKTYNTSLTYTFVQTDGKWYVADFIIN